MEIAEHIEALRQQGRQLADAAGLAGLEAPVPPCEPWRVKDLLRHTGYIHRWAASHITEPRDEVLDGPPEDEILKAGAPDDELIAWFRDGHAALADALSRADPGLRTATFMPAPSPLAFWARRQAHETAIHRADADSACNRVPQYAPAFAADGIDELIMGFARRRKYDPAREYSGTLRVLATDTGHQWFAQASDGRFRSARGGDGDRDQTQPGSCTVSGPASGLYLFLWNRIEAASAGVRICGDAGLFSLWCDSVRVRWG